MGGGESVRNEGIFKSCEDLVLYDPSHTSFLRKIYEVPHAHWRSGTMLGSGLGEVVSLGGETGLEKMGMQTLRLGMGLRHCGHLT